MEPKFWLERWEGNQIGFHQAEHNPHLVEYWQTLEVSEGAKVFVPLCGKSLDMRWLESRGHSVVGVELSQLAVEDYFEGADNVEKDRVDSFVSYRCNQMQIYQGDFFDLTDSLLEDVDAVFDRAALIALPPEMRARYVEHMLGIVPVGCRILLITLEYDQARVSGPPHAVLRDEVEGLFRPRCDIDYVDSILTSELPPKFQQGGVGEASESIYVITKRY